METVLLKLIEQLPIILTAIGALYGARQAYRAKKISEENGGIATAAAAQAEAAASKADELVTKTDELATHVEKHTALEQDARDNILRLVAENTDMTRATADAVKLRKSDRLTLERAAADRRGKGRRADDPSELQIATARLAVDVANDAEEISRHTQITSQEIVEIRKLLQERRGKPAEE